MCSTSQTPSVIQLGTRSDGDFSSGSSPRQAAMRIIRPGWPDLQQGSVAAHGHCRKTLTAIKCCEFMEVPDETVIKAKALPVCCCTTTSHEDGEHVAFLLVGFCMTSLARRPDASMAPS